MNAGQRAMVTAKARLLSNQTVRDAARVSGVSHARVVQSSVVLEYRSDLADDVIAGTLPLNDAYAQAKARKDGKDTAEALPPGNCPPQPLQ